MMDVMGCSDAMGMGSMRLATASRAPRETRDFAQRLRSARERSRMAARPARETADDHWTVSAAITENSDDTPQPLWIGGIEHMTNTSAAFGTLVVVDHSR